jgi:hypothetical protein
MAGGASIAAFGIVFVAFLYGFMVVGKLLGKVE